MHSRTDKKIGAPNDPLKLCLTKRSLENRDSAWITLGSITRNCCTGLFLMLRTEHVRYKQNLGGGASENLIDDTFYNGPILAPQTKHVAPGITTCEQETTYIHTNHARARAAE